MIEKLGVKILQPQKKEREPWLKRRLHGEVDHLQKDLVWIRILSHGDKIKTRFHEVILRKFWLKVKGYSRVMEELKQSIKSNAAEIKRYKKKMEMF